MWHVFNANSLKLCLKIENTLLFTLRSNFYFYIKCLILELKKVVRRVKIMLSNKNIDKSFFVCLKYYLMT